MAPIPPKKNPFPGLRPFREKEEQYFFGREHQVDAMVNKLATTRFLAVVGTSGSGKSSLVNCGLRPALHRGFLAEAGSTWRMAQFRPGSNPIRSLAQALADKDVLYPESKRDIPLEDIIETYLNQSVKGIADAFRKARLPEGTNLLVVADQFEELFRYQKLGTTEAQESAEKTIAFVNLLLAAAAEPDCSIYVTITMRSDFLGDCSQFYGLPEAINQAQYLVPRMTRDERRASIAGPIAVGGAEIDPILLTRLVNDVGDNPDQLSILQHALHRTWACWESHGAQGPLALDHYAEIGTMTEALNQHADEAFNALSSPEEKKTCEKVFKALTDLGTDSRGIRRPLKLATLAQIAGSEESLKPVLECFRDPSRAFLMPPASEPVKAETVIDISHESLMRVWKRLRLWAEEEAVSARRYRRLAETAALEKIGQARLWRDPDLQSALDWQEDQAPTATWSNLYGGDFESAMAFLERSRAERNNEMAEVVFAARWHRIKLFIGILVGVTFLALFKLFDFWIDFWGVAGARAALVAEFSITQVIYHLRYYLVILLTFTCSLGPFFLAYFGLTYLAKRRFRRISWPKILQEVAHSYTKAGREQKLAGADADAVIKLQTTYAGFWRRAGAYAIDAALFVAAVIGTFFLAISTADFIAAHIGRDAVGFLFVLPLLASWLYQALMLRSGYQATLGMLLLRIIATTQKGYRLSFGRATVRHSARFLSYFIGGMGFLSQPVTARHQTLHDFISGTVVLVRPDKKKVPSWVIVLCVILGLIEIAPILWLLQTG